ncbi:MAG: helix-turn-helix transcriptional regulator [Candidatus Thermoplasmatota archaeon]|nr:helix-turn-helix transcriptional regulator [Candidatus Thermoplasmatota archaeon]
MSAPLPPAPLIGWFEMEVLYLLLEKERYGNEIRMLLMRQPGEEIVSTGKLYPVLKNLEKHGFIRKLPKRTKERISSDEGMTSRLLTRGVDRVYFEITDRGKKELDSSVAFATAVLYNLKMGEVLDRLKERVRSLTNGLGQDARIGIAALNTPRAVSEAKELASGIERGQVLFLLMGSAQEEAPPMPNSFPARFDDIPLRSNYLDIVISTVHLSGAPESFPTELVRTVRSNGKVVFADILKTPSSVLSSILTLHAEHGINGEYHGQDPSEIERSLGDRLTDVKVTTFSEMFMLEGVKPKRK